MFSLTSKSTGNDTLLLSITNTGVFNGTGHTSYVIAVLLFLARGVPKI